MPAGIHLTRPPRRHSEPELLSVGNLLRRGWTAQLIRKFAGPADFVASNPHNAAWPGVKCFQAARIAEIEKTESFIQAREATERRREGAKKAVQTRAAKVAASAADSIEPPVLPAAPRAEIIAAAIDWHNRVETWRAGKGRWVSFDDSDDVLFPIAIDFIFDRLSDYRRRAAPIGIPIQCAAAAVDARIAETITTVYPWLREECAKRC
jgi:hypothetical protein